MPQTVRWRMRAFHAASGAEDEGEDCCGFGEDGGGAMAMEGDPGGGYDEAGCAPRRMNMARQPRRSIDEGEDGWGGGEAKGLGGAHDGGGAGAGLATGNHSRVLRIPEG